MTSSGRSNTDETRAPLKVGVNYYARAVDEDEGEDFPALAEVERTDEDAVQVTFTALDGPHGAVTMSRAAAQEIASQIDKLARADW